MIRRSSWRQISDIKQFFLTGTLGFSLGRTRSLFRKWKKKLLIGHFLKPVNEYSFANSEPLFGSRLDLEQLRLVTKGNFSVLEICKKSDVIWWRQKKIFCSKIPKIHTLLSTMDNQLGWVTWIMRKFGGHVTGRFNFLAQIRWLRSQRRAKNFLFVLLWLWWAPLDFNHHRS